MNDFESPFSDASTHFAQTGAVNDPSLTQLRDQIKKVMIPLLIKTFQFKHELNQQSPPPPCPAENIVEQLKILDNDLKVLLLWCQSCRTQIQTALSIPEEQKSSVTTSIPTTANTVSKSFSETALFQPPAREKEVASLLEPQPLAEKTWWEKLKGVFTK
jgi:hypothetical protein